MPKFYITFGQVHIHRFNGQFFDKDTICEITASDYGAARHKAFEVFDIKFASVYIVVPTLAMYSKGIVPLK